MTPIKRANIIGLSFIIAATACGRGTDAAQADPNRPAVIHAPPVVLPGDTAKRDTMPDYRDRMSALARQLAGPYSLISAMAVLGDQRMLATNYSPDAVLRIGDSTYTGQVQVTYAMTDLARRTSMKEFVRMSRVVNATDSVATDSGSYTMIAQRAGAPSTQERGLYVSTWKRQAGDPPWLLRHDLLIPLPGPPAPKKR